MNAIAKFAVPAVLALAAFGAQAEGFTPSAGGVYKGPVASVSAPAVQAAPTIEAYVPVAGGQFKAPTDAPMRKAGTVSPIDLKALTVGA